MSQNLYEIVALAARYAFAGLMVLIVLRAWRITLVDSRRAATLRHLSPSTGISGELVVLGGGMSSRLFQRIREELGMAYSVYSGPSSYPHCGEYTIYAATSPRNAQTVLEQMETEIARLLEGGVTEKEFAMSKAQLKGSFILGLESAYNRMSALGHNQILLNRVIPPEDTIAAIDRVSMDDVMDTARRILQGPRAYAVVGRNAEKYVKYMK